MNSGHVAERVCVHVCMSGSSKGDFVLLELLTLVASRNTKGGHGYCSYTEKMEFDLSCAM